MQAVRPVSALGTALGQGTRAVGRGAWKALGAASMHPAFWMLDFMGPSEPMWPELSEADIETARRLYGLGLSEEDINTLHYEGLLSDPMWVDWSQGTQRFDTPQTMGRSGYEVPGAAEASRRAQLPQPVPGGYVAQPGEPGYRPMIRPQHPQPAPITPGGYVAQPGEPGYRPTDPPAATTSWQDTYREVFGENYQPGLEPIRADMQAMPVAPPQTMTVKTGHFRNPMYGRNLSKDHPQSEAAQGQTFRISPVHEVLRNAATRTQNRLPTGIHSSPVGLGDTSLIMSKRDLPVQSPLTRRM